MAILHWKQAKDVDGTYRQLSYTNVYDLKIPVTASPADARRNPQEVRNALYSVLSKKRTTGIYGTTYTLKEVNFEQGYILVESSTYIGD